MALLMLSLLLSLHLLSLHNPVARAARALAGRYTARPGDRPNFEPRACRDIFIGLAIVIDGRCASRISSAARRLKMRERIERAG